MGKSTAATKYLLHKGFSSKSRYIGGTRTLHSVEISVFFYLFYVKSTFEVLEFQKQLFLQF